VDVIGEGKLEELALPQAGARRWIDAVNHWGRIGRWRYAKIYSPHELASVLAVDPGLNVNDA